MKHNIFQARVRRKAKLHALNPFREVAEQADGVMPGFEDLRRLKADADPAEAILTILAKQRGMSRRAVRRLENKPARREAQRIWRADAVKRFRLFEKLRAQLAAALSPTEEQRLRNELARAGSGPALVHVGFRR